MKGALESVSKQLDQPAQNARYARRGGAWGKVGEKPGRVTDPKKCLGYGCLVNLWRAHESKHGG